MRNRENLVLVYDPGVYGFTVGGLQAHTTLVRWANGGMEYELYLEDDEFELLEDDPFE